MTLTHGGVANITTITMRPGDPVLLFSLDVEEVRLKHALGTKVWAVAANGLGLGGQPITRILSTAETTAAPNP